MKEKQVYTDNQISTGIQSLKYVLFFESIHIPLWLIKDLCWLMEYKSLGIIMAIPTILVAFIMVYLTKNNKDQFLPNISIVFWILANANWMFDEFFDLGIKKYSLYPFIAGILVYFIHVSLKLIEKRKLN